MPPTMFNAIVEIPAMPSLVWSVMADVERWPEWTRSVSKLKLLTPGPLRVGSRARIHQPRLPPAWWRVTALEPEAQFTWVSRAPGLRVTARHGIERCAVGSRVTLAIGYEGWLGRLLARGTHTLNSDYLAMEASGLRERCMSIAKAA